MTITLIAGHELTMPPFPLHLSAVCDGMADGLAVVDADGQVLFRNAAAARYLEHGGRCEFRRPDGTPVPTGEAVHAQALRGVPTPRMEVAAGDMIAEVTAAVLPGSQTVVLGWRDVTAARWQIDALTRFAGEIAHDLRNPLCVIESWSLLLGDLLAGISESEVRRDARDALDRVGRAVLRIRALIDDTLADVTNAAPRLSHEPVALDDLVAEVAAGHVDLALGKRGPTPQFTIGALPVVCGDRALLRQLLENLVGNAVKYTAPGLVPTLTFVAEAVRPELVSVHIDDNGIGVPAGARAAIFDDFRRADDDGSRTDFPGYGLGLGICRRIVERHGGTIGVGDNPSGAGSRFTVTLSAWCECPGSTGSSAPHR